MKNVFFSLAAGFAAMFLLGSCARNEQTVNVILIKGEPSNSLSVCALDSAFRADAGRLISDATFALPGVEGIANSVALSQAFEAIGDSIVTPIFSAHKDSISAGTRWEPCGRTYSVGFTVGYATDGVRLYPTHTILYTGSRRAISKMRARLREAGINVPYK